MCITTGVLRQTSPDLEYLAPKRRAFYIPREFTAVLITAVYTPPQANAKQALEVPHTAISSQLNACPEGTVIVAGVSTM